MDIREADKEEACYVCGEFANIRCTNCTDLWLCTDHVEQHKIHHHCV